MDRINYQIWLKAIPLEHAIGKKKKSDVLFSTDLGKKSLFKIFGIMKSEVKSPSKEEGLNPVEIIFKTFADEDLSSDEMIEKTFSEYLNKLRDYEPLINKINNILISLRNRKIKFWENMFDSYLMDEEKNNEELKKLWIDRRTRLVDF